MRAIFAEEGLATGGRPLHRGQQESITAAQLEELLLGSGTETLLADYLAALAFQQCRSDDFRRARGARVDQSYNRSREDCCFRVGGEGFQRFTFATDRLGNHAVLHEEVCDSRSFRKRTTRGIAEVNNDLLRALFREILQARANFRSIAIAKAVDSENANATSFHARFRGGGA